ncbi:hypothetical protein [Streptomyces sp. NPDC058335]|uniref:hypothetical protein n=1 Tax=Streptomyces sp. NPDC058335 TaxID=3346451 RepID=UPI0036465B87
MAPKDGAHGVRKPFLFEYSVEAQRNTGMQQRASPNNAFHFPEPLLLTAQCRGVRTSAPLVHVLRRPKVRRVPHKMSLLPVRHSSVVLLGLGGGLTAQLLEVDQGEAYGVDLGHLDFPSFRRVSSATRLVAEE